MLTETEAVANATALALRGADGWGKTEASKASAALGDMLAKGKIDAPTFANAVMRCTGNHSQRRQQLISWGLVASKETDSAEKRAILDAMKKLDEASDKALADVK
jgi:hypothetical protein